jgi:P4 family phage/plasmid primase-like protien
MINNLAVQLYAAGLGVFPCSANKAPAVPKGVAWQHVATGNPQGINWPSGLVGLPIPAGVVVLDLDTYKGVTREQVEAVIGCRLPWDQALIQTTMHGGQHYAFATTWPVIQGTNIKVEGFDTRVAGKGYICSGEGYTPVGFGPYAMAHPESLPVLPDSCRKVLEHLPAKPTERTELPEGDKDVETIKQALSHISPGCSRSEWLRVGLALRHQFHDDESTGLALFDAWSSGRFTATGDAPENYSAETMDHQWGSFKAEGGLTIATLFYSAISAGWTPPAGLDTSAAFGGTAATAGQFDQIIDDITENGGNPKSTNALITAIQAVQCNGLQRGILLATLHRELKENGLLTKDVKKLLEGKKPPRPQGEYGANHTENATVFIDTHYPNGTICRSQQVWYVFNGKAWEQREDEDIAHEVAIALAPSMPQVAVVTGTATMMRLLATNLTKKIGDIPEGIVLMQNGALDLNTGRLTGHHKDYFTTNILPYSYNIQARSAEWGQFMWDAFEGDEERIDLLQEWFGYMMSSSYDYQKVMLLLGPKRCGKGTIGRVLKLLVGEQNYTGGTLTSFARDSFIESLRTKTVMFIGDAAKNIPRGVVDYVVERVKGISGCDDQTFDRKYKSTLSEQLPTRITIAGNHVPRLFDDSGALASRLVVLPMNVSWYGREDPTLFGRLVQDIEGIAIWALQGLARLNQNGRFTIPAASQAETDYISEAYSPLRMFLDSACIMGGVEFVSAEDVYSTYKAWAVLNQEDHILPRRTFIGSFKDLTRGTGIIYGPHRTPGASPVRGFKGLTLRQLGQGGSIPLTAVK